MADEGNPFVVQQKPV